MFPVQRLFVGAFVAALPFAASANLITNGSFETPDVATGTFSVFGSIPGWSTTFGPGIEIQDHRAGSPFAGDQLVELDSFGNSGMSQTVATIAGHSYVLSFAYSARPTVGTLSNTIEVLFDGVLLDTLAANGTGLADTSWTVHSYLVSATGASSTLEFRAAGTSDALGGYIDDVQLLPEPATALLIGLGALGLGWSRRKRA